MPGTVESEGWTPLLLSTSVPSWSTYLPLLATAIFLCVGFLGCLIVVLVAARWVLNAYRSGPALVERLEQLEADLAAGLAEAKTVTDKRYRGDRQKARRAEKAGTVDQLPPEIADLVQKGMSPLPDTSGTDNGNGPADRKAALRRAAANVGR